MPDAPKASDDSKPFLARYATVIALTALLVSVAWYGYSILSKPSGAIVVARGDYASFGVPPSFLRVDMTEGSNAGNYKGQLGVSLLNTGDKVARNVRLRANTQGIAVVDWGDGNKKENNFTNELLIGDVPPAKPIGVAIWTIEPIKDELPYVAHDAGIAAIDFVRVEKSAVQQAVIYASWLLTALAIIALLAARKYSSDTLMFAKQINASAHSTTSRAEELLAKIERRQDEMTKLLADAAQPAPGVDTPHGAGEN
jgi:hypothetical protein